MDDECIRLLAWNCAGGFHRKDAIVREFAPDIAVLSEISEKDVPLAGDGIFWSWIGADPHRGLAVVGFNGWRIEAVLPPPGEKLFLPVVATKGSSRIQVIGVCIKRDGNYVKPTLGALDGLTRFIETGVTIVAGDFNQSAHFDRSRNPRQPFSRVVSRLASLGLRSAWHDFHAEEFGMETKPTHFWRWNEDPGSHFHIDYAFASNALEIRSLELGSYNNYAARKISDHAPLLVEFVLSTPASLLTISEAL